MQWLLIPPPGVQLALQAGTTMTGIQALNSMAINFEAKREKMLETLRCLVDFVEACAHSIPPETAQTMTPVVLAPVAAPPPPAPPAPPPVFRPSYAHQVLTGKVKPMFPEGPPIDLQPPSDASVAELMQAANRRGQQPSVDTVPPLAPEALPSEPALSLDPGSLSPVEFALLERYFDYAALRNMVKLVSDMAPDVRQDFLQNIGKALVKRDADAPHEASQPPRPETESLPGSPDTGDAP